MKAAIFWRYQGVDVWDDTARIIIAAIDYLTEDQKWDVKLVKESELPCESQSNKQLRKSFPELRRTYTIMVSDEGLFKSITTLQQNKINQGKIK